MAVLAFRASRIPCSAKQQSFAAQTENSSTKDNTYLNQSLASEQSVPGNVDQLLRELEQARAEGDQLRNVLSEKNDQIYRDYLTIETLRGKLDGLKNERQAEGIHKQETFSKVQPGVKKNKSKNDLLFRQNTNVVPNYHFLERTGDSEEVCRLKAQVVEGFHKFMHEYAVQWQSVNIIFNHLKTAPDQTTISKKALLSQLRKLGILSDDPRVCNMVEHLEPMPDMISAAQLSTALRGENMRPNPNLEFILKVVNDDLLIPKFSDFSKEIEKMFKQCKTNNHGENAAYIPELANCPPENWGLSVCTVEGQRLKLGDANYPFSIQSCSKPINYAIAMEDLGPDKVHQHVGQEPSGQAFNALIVNENGLPHNPLINSGAIMVASLLRHDLKESARYAHVLDVYQRLAGGKKFEYDNKVYLSEKSQPWGNKALAYLMMKTGAFPEWIKEDGSKVDTALNFYFMLCSLESDADRMSVVAATLANNGICPLTGEQVLSQRVVRDTLSIMFCCGMYDYSGKFAFDIGVPAKSGVGGGIMIVIPGVMGLCTYSPRLDKFGNSSRGVQFCSMFSDRFSFHQFSIEQDPLVSPYVKDLNYELLSCAAKGNLLRIKQIVREMLKDETTAIMNITRGDYDRRTALHLACTEGHYQIAEYLLRKGFSDNLNVLDRWNNTPMDDAKSNGHSHIVQLLQSYAGLAFQKQSTLRQSHQKKESIGMKLDGLEISAIEENQSQNRTKKFGSSESFTADEPVFSNDGKHNRFNSAAGFKQASPQKFYYKQ